MNKGCWPTFTGRTGPLLLGEQSVRQVTFGGIGSTYLEQLAMVPISKPWIVLHDHGLGTATHNNTLYNPNLCTKLH